MSQLEVETTHYLKVGSHLAAFMVLKQLIASRTCNIADVEDICKGHGIPESSIRKLTEALLRPEEEQAESRRTNTLEL